MRVLSIRTTLSHAHDLYPALADRAPYTCGGFRCPLSGSAVRLSGSRRGGHDHDSTGGRVPLASAFVAMMDSKTAGENGALEHSDAGSPLVALFFKLVRSLPDDSLASLTAAVPAEPASLADLTVLAFQTRATRGMGKGKKDLFYKMLAALPVEAATATLHLVPHFGYWKD